MLETPPPKSFPVPPSFHPIKAVLTAKGRIRKRISAFQLYILCSWVTVLCHIKTYTMNMIETNEMAHRQTFTDIAKTF